MLPRFCLLPAALLAAALAAPLPAQFRPSRDRAPEPPREFRGAWIATVHNIDWPSRPGLSASAQQAELRRILDRARSLGLNAVILQVRTSCDALYASRIEPWSHWLTGRMGRSPGYDPLQFAVQEAHARGLELHAWFNPFRAVASTRMTISGDHVSRRQKEHIRSYGGQIWLDPGEPWVRDRALDVIEDVTRRYDVDGIHIDDYFYPYPKKGAGGFPDDRSFSRHGRGDRGDWRRANVDRFVKEMGQRVHRQKSWVKVGISPFGIWRPGVPAGIEAGLDAYGHLHADSRKWLREGWCDYLSPQLYWRIDPPAQSFPRLLSWWAGEGRGRRHVWPGIATSRIKSSDDPGRPASEITRQIGVTRKLATRPSTGHIHWSVKALMTDRGGINSRLKSGPYAGRALVPETPWLGAPSPPASLLGGEATRSGWMFRWGPQERGDLGKVRWWAVQARHGGRWHLAAVLAPGQTAWEIARDKLPDAVAIRAIGFNGKAGKAAVVER